MLLLLAVAAHADETLVLDGIAPEDGLPHFTIPFDVPEGVAEVQVQLDDGSDANILDWGVLDPDGWRGWGGGNTEPAVIGVDAASRSYVPGPLPAGIWQVVVGKARIVELPATWQVEIVLRDAPTLAPQPDRQPWSPHAPLEVGERWYAGDLHVHSEESGDASATFDEIAALARDRGLDFVVITDHDTIAHHDQLVAAQARNADVLLIPGMEFTTYAGHANVIGATGWLDHRIPGEDGSTIEAVAASVAAQGALLSLNHPTLDLGALCIGCAWDHAIPEPLAAVEIATGGVLRTGGLYTWSAIALWDDLCADGRRLAAVGGSDDHRAGTGTGAFASPIGDPTTLVWASELSVDGILAGIAAGRTVVKLAGPDDPLVELSTDRGPADGTTTWIGGDQVLTATVTGGGESVRFVVDGTPTAPIPIDADPFVATLPLEVVGETRVRAEVLVDGDPRTVTSHLWLAPPPEDAPVGPGGCGCVNGAPHPSSLAPLALLAWVRRRRRARS